MFWYDDPNLLLQYQKAYIRNQHYIAWVNGQYTLAAFSIALSNAFAKKGTQPKKWIEWKDPLKKLEEVVLTEDNIEEEYTQSIVSQNSFINRLKTHK